MKKQRKQRPKDLLRPNRAAMRRALRRTGLDGAHPEAFDAHLRALVHRLKM